MPTLPPFRGLKHPKEVWAWGMFDLANQSFTLLINTLLFAIFFKAVVLADHPKGDFIWSILVSSSMLIVVVASPILGSFADQYRSKKPLLITSALLCAALTATLAALPAASSPADIAIPLTIAALCYIPANILFNLGENLLAAFLPEISERNTMGRVSAIGWTMGYIGALTVLAIVAAIIAIFSINTVDQWRPLILFAAIWFAINIIPTAIILKERHPDGTTTDSVAGVPIAADLRNSINDTKARFINSIRQLPNFKDLLIVLVGFLIYGMGVQVVIFFAGVIAKDDFAFSETALVAFAALIALTAGIAAAATGIFQDRIGHKQTIFAYLALWIITAIALAALVRAAANNPDLPRTAIYIVGIGVGLGLGGVGTATRAIVGVFTPKSRTAEFFALWGFTYKLAGVVGIPIFGAVRTWIGSFASILVLATFFIIGATILTACSIARGVQTADDADARDAHTPHQPRHVPIEPEK